MRSWGRGQWIPCDADALSQFLSDPLVLEEGQECEFTQRRNRADGFVIGFSSATKSQGPLDGNSIRLSYTSHYSCYCNSTNRLAKRGSFVLSFHFYILCMGCGMLLNNCILWWFVSGN